MTKIYLNRHTSPLPTHKCEIIIKDKNKDILCEWQPFNKKDYTEDTMPGEGYLGSVILPEPIRMRTKYHAWAQNDTEFVWYTYPQKN